MGVQILYLFKIPISFPLAVYPEVRMLDHMVVLFFLFFEETPYCFSQLLCRFTFPPTVYRIPFSPHPHKHLSKKKIFLLIAILTGVR